MEKQWWYVVADTRRGPASVQELELAAHRGELTASTLVWTAGQAGWLPMQEVVELAPILQGLPTDLPPALPTVAVSAPLAVVPAAAPAPTTAELAAAAAEAKRAELAQLPLAGPWRRFLARTVDLWIFVLPVAVLIGLAAAWVYPGFGLLLDLPGASGIFGIVLVPTCMLVEGLVHGLFRNSPGKWLFGIKVLTFQGIQPTLRQYLSRQVSVWSAGVGIGIPLVSLFTMLHQRGRLVKGQPAGYDVEKFVVKARPLGFLRVGAMVLAVVAVALANGYFTSQEVASKSQQRYGFEWVNPVTGKRVSVPPTWTLENQTNSEGDPVYVFGSYSAGGYVYFAREATSLDLERYQRAWMHAMRTTMLLSSGGISDGKRFDQAEATGSMRSDPSQRVHATLVRGASNEVWRVIVVSLPGKESVSAESRKLRELLLGSI